MTMASPFTFIEVERVPGFEMHPETEESLFRTFNLLDSVHTITVGYNTSLFKGSRTDFAS